MVNVLGGLVMVLGIDLGTTYSASAYLDDSGEPQIAINGESQRLTPSVVFFDEGNQIIVGEVAKENEALYTDDVISKVKIDMGKRKVFKTINNVEYTPEVISSLVIKKIIQDSSANIGKEVKDVVITVPAYFMDSQRKATEDAAKLAGVNLLTMIDEPTAAAIYYKYKSKTDNAKLLIYDFGGGTFDATLMEVNNDKIRIIEKDGLSRAGGTMFDQFLVDYVCDSIQDKYDVDLADEEYRSEYNDLFRKVESCKRQLSVREKATISLKVDKIKEQIEITREFFESKIEGTYNKTENIIKKILRNAGLQAVDIEKVILVGGSSKIPYVIKRLTELFGKAPSKEINPDEAVAMGAALYGFIYQQNISEGKAVFQDVSSHSIGILVFIDETHQENQIIIPRTTQIPCTMEQVFYTKFRDQRQINVSITEGEFKEPEFVALIGEYLIDLPVGLPINTEVMVKISLDDRQLIHLSIAVPSVKLEREFEMKRNANLCEEEIRKLQGIMSKKTIV